MKRPLCLFCMTFVVVLVLCRQFVVLPVMDYEEWDGQRLIAEGQVYRKEYHSQKEILVLYLTSIHISDKSKKSLNIPQHQLHQIVCDMEDGSEPPIGSRILVEGEIRCFGKATNPGEFDMANYYRIMKLDFRLTDTRLIAGDTSCHWLEETLYRMKRHFSQTLENYYAEKHASVLKAMLLGDKTNLNTEIKELYMQSGIIHVIAISGLHISIIGMGLYRLLRNLRLPIGLSAVLSAAFIWCYGIMSGMSNSAVRAIFMFVLHLTAKMAGRTYDMLTALSLAAVLLLLEQPRYLENSGFLFSFGAVAAIGVLAPVLNENSGKAKKTKWFKKYFECFKQEAMSGIAIALVTLPVHLYFYYQFSLLSILLNLIILPFMSIIMYDGIICLLLGDVLPYLIKRAAYINTVILNCYELCCRLCRTLSYGNVIAGQPQRWQNTVYILMLVLFVLWAKMTSRIWKILWITAALSILFLRPTDGLAITVLDVGQGDCIHIRNDSGKHYLIDGGSTSKREVENYQITPYLKSQGAERLAAVFVTHADADHCNGILQLLAEANYGGVKIDYLILPDIGADSRKENYLELQKTAEEQGIPIKYMSRGEYITDGSLRITCLHPLKGYAAEDVNGASLVLQLVYGKFRGLFAGDVEGEGETVLEEYIRKRDDRDVTYLKVAHHGSRNSTKEELLQIIKPEMAVISCASGNAYGHPHKEALERLRACGCKVYVTKDSGAVTVWTDGKIMRVNTFR